MALIKCKECGHEVSSKASACPNCGCPIPSGDNPSENETSVKPHPPTKGKAKTYVLFAIILCLLMGGGYYAYNNFFKDEDIVELTPEFIEAIRKYDYAYSFSEGFAAVKKDEKYGFINTKGEEIVPCRYDYAESFLDGKAKVRKGEKVGFINTKGEEVVPCRYDYADYFSEGFATIKKDEKYGFINTKGEEVVPCRYDYAESFSEGFATIKKDEKYGFINTKGEEVIPCKYDEADSFSEGFAMIVKDEKYGFINTKGEEVVPCKYNYVYVSEFSSYSYCSFSEGFAAVNKDWKWGFVNTKGEEVIPCRYGYAYPFSEGFAAVEKDGKWGYINTKGEEVVPCKYDREHESDPCSFSNGFAFVVKENKYIEFSYKYGFVNTKGEEVVPCKYDRVESFSRNGVALAVLDCGERAIYGFIDKLGNTTFSKSDYDRHLAYEKQQEEEARKAEEERIRQEEEARLQGKEVIITMSADVDGTQFLNKQCSVGENSTYWDDIISRRMKVPEGKVLIFKYHELDKHDTYIHLNWMGVDVYDKNGNTKHYETRSCGEFAIFEGETFRTRINLSVGNKGHLDAIFHFREKDNDLY